MAFGMYSVEWDVGGRRARAGQCEVGMGASAWGEGTVELYGEAGAEFLGIGRRPPDSRGGRAQNDLFLDPVCSVMQLHGCILPRQLLGVQPAVCIASQPLIPLHLVT